ncbi:sulfotransferase 4A1-like [Haliotis rufescens]|uniref:sulfotransferase 4A1-like n=1 Tax=Haliotis rufescens TaxID=6454 RepID=UPI001EB06576|nr:sulfotransferase 4A1-like [Haliotis rufescens]
MCETPRPGDYLPLMEYDGCEFQVYPGDRALHTHITQVRDLAVRQDDVFIIGYPYSGCSSLWNILTSLPTPGSDDHHRTGQFHLLDRTSADQLADLPSPRLLHSHYPLRFLPSQILTHKPKILYLVRNPKDVCVSQYLHTQKGRGGCRRTFQSFLQAFLNHSTGYDGWFHHVRQYQQDFTGHRDLLVHTLRFEDTQANPYKQTRGLCKFLDLDMDEEAIGDLVEATCDTSKMQPAKRVKTEAHCDGMPLTSDMYDTEGQVGEWKNWLTVTQDEEFDDAIRGHLDGTGLELRCSL